MLASRDGEREVALADYFTGYRQTVRRPGELIKTIRDPAAGRPGHRVPQDRQAPVRRHLQRGVAFAPARSTDGVVVADIKIGLGGVAATPIRRATATEEALTGDGPWTTEASADRRPPDVLGRARARR